MVSGELDSTPESNSTPEFGERGLMALQSSAFRMWCGIKVATGHTLSFMKFVPLVICCHGVIATPLLIVVTADFRAKGSGQVHPK